MTPALLFPDMAELPGFAFPQPLSEKYRPTRIADFAGLAETKRTLLGFVANPRAIGLLFVGPAGTGKTSMGIAIARELAGLLACRTLTEHPPSPIPCGSSPATQPTAWLIAFSAATAFSHSAHTAFSRTQPR